MEKEIQELRKAQEEQTSRLMQMEDDTARMERNKLRDRLLENCQRHLKMSIFAGMECRF